MARAKKNAQGSFEDVLLPDPEGELAGHIEAFLATAESMATHGKADRAIKRAVPAVEKRTRFLVGELYIVEAVPLKRNAYSVGAGSTQRLRIKDAGEA